MIGGELSKNAYGDDEEDPLNGGYKYKGSFKLRRKSRRRGQGKSKKTKKHKKHYKKSRKSRKSRKH
jgi:hypothetical protein